MKHVVVAFCAMAVAATCAPRQSPHDEPASAAASADTIVGVVREVGADPTTSMAVRPSAGGGSLRLSGVGAAILRSVSGAEVWLAGARLGDTFRVDAFEVRQANAQPVDDGIVRVEGVRVFIRMRSGAEREVPDAPPALRSLVGVRVWVTRPVVGQAPSYGMIQRP